MTCVKCKIERMGHYADWCACTKPEFTLTPVDNLNVNIPKGLGKLLT